MYQKFRYGDKNQDSGKSKPRGGKDGLIYFRLG